MQNKQITADLAEIGLLIKQTEEAIAEKDSALSVLEKERDDFESEIESLGLLGVFKFKERALLKEKLADTERKIEENCGERNYLKEKANVLKQNESEIRNKQQRVKKEKEQIQKEEDLIQAAKQGDSQAQFDVAKMYLKQRDTTQALYWFEQAAITKSR